MGPIESAVRADIETLGALRGAQPTLAAAAINLASKVDRGADEKVSRELRMTIRDLFDYPYPATVSADDEEAPVLDSIEELRARRQRREAGEGA